MRQSELLLKRNLENGLPCFRCGICCTKFQVRISVEEARQIAKKLDVPWENWLEKYTDARWPGTASFLLRHCESGCVFLNPAKGKNGACCLIHTFRPSSCREWTPGLHRPECQEGLSRYWGITVSPSGELVAPEHKLRDFYSFLESLATPCQP